MVFMLVALTGVVLDVLWTLLIQAIQRKRPIRASVYQGLFTFLAVGATWYIVQDASVSSLFAYAVGSSIGTYFVVRYCGLST
jgi:hypothetical protein